MNPPDILAMIVAQKRLEVEATRQWVERGAWRGRVGELPPPPDFYAALAGHSTMRIIAELKKASPSAGVLRDPYDPVAIAQSYERAGAACLSVLTDARFFLGSLADLDHVRHAVALPLLRKDFVIDPCQIIEARAHGASAVLLIAECLSRGQLADLVGEIQSHQMTPLVELYDPENLENVLASGTPLVGINNRNLRTFHTDLEHTLALRPAIPGDRLVVSESGIRTRDDVERLHQAGVQAILVGEAFMRASDPGAKLRELVGPPGPPPLPR